MSGGHQIFISYKFSDTNVQQNLNSDLFEKSERPFGSRTPRDYVNVLQTYIENYSPHYYKGEEDGESLQGKTDEYIWEHLKDLIFDSTLTIVLISPSMKTSEPEREQRIPWEIRYSLAHETRLSNNGKEQYSATNAMMAIVLPDKNGSYDYYFETKTCCESGCRLHKNGKLFRILRNNTFNRKNNSETYSCKIGDKIYCGKKHSYITFYKWSEINDINKLDVAIKLAYEIQSEQEKYDINKEI